MSQPTPVLAWREQKPRHSNSDPNVVKNACGSMGPDKRFLQSRLLPDVSSCALHRPVGNFGRNATGAMRRQGFRDGVLMRLERMIFTLNTVEATPEGRKRVLRQFLTHPEAGNTLGVLPHVIALDSRIAMDRRMSVCGEIVVFDTERRRDGNGGGVFDFPTVHGVLDKFTGPVARFSSEQTYYYAGQLAYDVLMGVGTAASSLLHLAWLVMLLQVDRRDNIDQCTNKPSQAAQMLTVEYWVAALRTAARDPRDALGRVLLFVRLVCAGRCHGEPFIQVGPDGINQTCNVTAVYRICKRWLDDAHQHQSPVSHTRLQRAAATGELERVPLSQPIEWQWSAKARFQPVPEPEPDVVWRTRHPDAASDETVSTEDGAAKPQLRDAGMARVILGNGARVPNRTARRVTVRRPRV